MKFTLYKLLIVLIFCLLVITETNGQKVNRNGTAHIPSGNVCLEKNYKPKSESQIVAMSPRQLIDERIKSYPGAFRTYEELANYEDSIEKRIRQAGVKALPVLTEYMNNSFHSQSAFKCDDSHFATVQRIANDIDRFEFRLRGTSEGKQTIDAFERAIKRIEKPGFAKKDKSYYRTMFLSYLKGINEIDRAIQDTFWVNNGIKMSESELLEFSNFLTARNSAYPSWSDKDFIKDYSRINEAGNPLQVYIIKKPELYYEAYLKFKKRRVKNDPFRDKM
jgi:hypothetical protein